MNQELMQWLIGGLVVFGVGFVGASITAYISLVQRLTKIETTIDLLGEKAARVLHSPHTPDLDRLLEKYVDRHYELSHAEWQELLERCQAIEDDITNPKDQRALAAIVSAVCSHKLMKAPPKFRQHYTD